MERSRDGKRGSVTAGNGLSRRRARSSGLRVSPEDGGVELQETIRLRSRGGKKDRDRDRDRDRSGRSKRRRGDRMMAGSNRDEGEDSSDESVDEEEEDEDDEERTAVLLPPLPSNLSPPSSSLQHNHPPRRGVPPRTAKSPPVWRAADEMIAVSVPRKARSAYAKRSHEHWVSGSSGNGGAGEQLRRQASTSPSRQIHAAAAPAPTSPSSSNASVRKRMKPVGGPKPRPTKVAKSPSSIQEIEIEVAEVLYGLTRQFQDPANKHDSKDTNGCVKDSKCRVLSPSSASAAPGIPKSSLLPPQNSSISTAPLPAVAPKRKRPRPVKFEEEHPTSPSVQSTIPGPLISSIRKASDGDKPKMEHPSPKSEKNSALSLAGNGETSLDLSSHSVGEKTADVEGELVMLDSAHVSDVKSPMPERGCHDAAETKEETPSGDSPREKLKIDLMVPPGNSSSAGETNPPVHEARKLRPVKGSNLEMGEIRGEEKTDESLMELGSRKPPVKERRPLDPPLDIVKQEGETIDAQKQGLRQQSEAPGAGSKPEKTIPHPSLALPMPVAGLPGTLPFGCMSQIPSLQALMPMDGRSSPYKAIQPPHLLPQQLRPKHCSTHCYIAKNIQYHQHIARLGPFWPAAAAAGVASLYGAKPSNPSAAPSPGPAPRSTGSVQDKASPHSSKEKCSSSSSLFADASQRKQLHQQPSPVGTSNSMLHAPAFIFPLNQPHPAAVVAATASRTAPVKPANPNVGSSPVSSSAATCSSSSDVNPSAVSFNYSNLPHGEAQYVVLQNGGYPFPIPAHIGATYRGGSHAQPLPFFNGSFYASQVLHPSQLQPQLPPATTGQQAHQPHTGTSSGSSSQKHPQQHQKNPAGYLSSSGGSTHGFPPSNQRQHQSSHQSVVEEGPSPSESRVSQSQKGIYSSNFSMPVHSQGFAFMSGPTAVVGTAATANHSDKQHHEPPPPQSHQHQHQLQLQQQSMKAAELNSAQAFAMSFAAMNGPNGSRHTGLDLPSKGQHQTIFQSLPPEAASQKKAQYQQSGDGKSMGDPITSGALSAGEDRKTAQAGGKTSSSVSHQSVAFSRTEVDPSSATLCINPVDGSARTLNLISSSAMNGSRASPNQSASSGQNSQQQQQQHLAHLQSQQHQQRQLQFQQQQQQQQQQQHLQMQQQQRHFQLQQQQQQQQQQLQLQQHLAAARGKPTGASDTAVYSERLPAGTVLRKYSSSAGGGSGGSSGGGYPQPMVQAGIPTQSLQWKSSPRGGPPIASSPSSAPAKNQQLGRAPPQLSFGMNSMKPAHSGPQQQQPAAGSLPSSASSGGASLGSPSTAISKGAGGSSPRASTGGKAAPSTQQPLQSKGAAAPSMLGQRHAAPPPSSAAKSHQEQQQQSQLQKQQSLPPSQLFFSNPYYQRSSSEQQQPVAPPSTQSGVLSLCPPSDAAKAAAAAAAGIKGLPPPSLLQAAQFAATSGAHTLMSAAGFPYLHAMPSVPVKPAEHKPAAGK